MSETGDEQMKTLKVKMVEAAKKWLVQSASDGRKFYTVTRRSGKYACSCPHWIFRRAMCKHIAAVRG